MVMMIERMIEISIFKWRKEKLLICVILVGRNRCARNEFSSWIFLFVYCDCGVSKWSLWHRSLLSRDLPKRTSMILSNGSTVKKWSILCVWRLICISIWHRVRRLFSSKETQRPNSNGEIFSLYLKRCSSLCWSNKSTRLCEKRWATNRKLHIGEFALISVVGKKCADACPGQSTTEIFARRRPSTNDNKPWREFLLISVLLIKSFLFQIDQLRKKH